MLSVSLPGELASLAAGGFSENWLAGERRWKAEWRGVRGERKVWEKGEEHREFFHEIQFLTEFGPAIYKEYLCLLKGDLLEKGFKLKVPWNNSM